MRTQEAVRAGLERGNREKKGGYFERAKILLYRKTAVQ